MVLTAYGALSPGESGFLATVALKKRELLEGLMPASRHQDHTLWPYADSVSSGAKKRACRYPHPPHP
jgi:hypothetical protein